MPVPSFVADAPVDVVLPPRYVEYTRADAEGFSSVTNALPSQLHGDGPTVSNAPGVVGKSPLQVNPVMYTLPEEATATLVPPSGPFPPRNVAESSVPAGANRAMKASSWPWTADWNAPAVVGKFGDAVAPTT